MIPIEGKLTRDFVAPWALRLEEEKSGQGPIALDLSGVTEADSAGIALLSVFARQMNEAGRPVRIVNASQRVQETLELFPFAVTEKREVKKLPPPLEALGEKTIEAWEVFVELLILSADAIWFAIAGLFTRTIRWPVVIYEMSMIGSRALGVVGLIAFLVGGTMALQSAAQLRQFGANIYVVDLVAISMTRELGPLMAAIVVAGRSGSAIAAEIGTMVITEEIDALKTMGLHPTRFLVVPKMLAIWTTQPLLTMLANVLGIAGGFLVASTYLEVSPSAFIARMAESMYMKDLVTGLVKSVIFAQLIVTVGVFCGFRTKGGADAVGRSTTSSVVLGIFAVIVADALASLVFYFGE